MIRVIHKDHIQRYAVFAVILQWTLLCFGQETTAFTYQGRLSESGLPANGNYDFQFTLMDASIGGKTIAGPLTLGSIAVTKGLFTVELDPGQGVFDGTERWLEIAVRTGGSQNGYTALSPRQRITAVPYAQHALSGAVASGVSLTSSIAGDPALIAEGYRQIASIAAPDWVDGTSTDQPTSRYRHSTVWSGSELIVWGGNSHGNVYLSSGGRYHPVEDRWTVVSTVGMPTARADHSAVWTGTEMLVWGGFGLTGYQASGGRYSPASQIWLSISTTQAPVARSQHIAVWNGGRMIVWGGRNHGGLLDDGGLYNPADNTWTPLSLGNQPVARGGMTAVWANDRLVVWGGAGSDGDLNTGAQLIFDANGVAQSWQTMSLVNAPVARSGHTAIWTGSRMIIWGGSRSGSFLNDGASYDPVSDVWTPISSTLAPDPRSGHSTVWNGSEMIIWGGESGSGSLSTGGTYHPVQDEWRALSNGGTRIARTGAGAQWSGTDILVFGGLSNQTPVAALQRVDPQPTWYFYRKP